MRRSRILYQDMNCFYAKRDANPPPPPRWMYSQYSDAVSVHLLETAHIWHLTDTARTLLLTSSSSSWGSSLYQHSCHWVLPNPSLDFSSSFASVTLSTGAWINRRADELRLLVWSAEYADRTPLYDCSLGMVRGTGGPLHWYSLLNIFKQAQMIFVKKKSLILFIMVINYFIHDHTWLLLPCLL